MVASCLNCGKYIFNAENTTKKKMTVIEYINGIIRRLEKTNKPTEDICKERQMHIQWLINRSCCELCGAPHAVFSDPDGPEVVYILFFFSGSTQPSEKDSQFIKDFQHNLFL